MSTTTPAAIRTAIAAIISGLTPTAHAGVRFVEHREESPIRDWAAANPGGCLRRFSCRWAGPLVPPTVTNTTEEWVERPLDVVITYPTDFRHGGRQLAGLDDAIAEDCRLIAHNVGTNGAANLATQLGAATVTITSEEDPGLDLGPVTLGVVRLAVRYYRSNAP